MMSRAVWRSRLPSTRMLISAPWGRSARSSLAGPVRPISTATVVVMIRSKKRNWKSLRLVLIWEGETSRSQPGGLKSSRDTVSGKHPKAALSIVRCIPLAAQSGLPTSPRAHLLPRQTDSPCRAAAQT